MTTTPILPTLRAGGVLKCGSRSQRFFIVQQSRELPVDQTAARKLASNGTLRPNGRDSHNNYVFALVQRGAAAPKEATKGPTP